MDNERTRAVVLSARLKQRVVARVAALFLSFFLNRSLEYAHPRPVGLPQTNISN
jgi:hypothetical protein